MSQKSFKIEVQNDHLEKLSSVRKPVIAIAELIWNAVDADATRVDVAIEYNALGGLDLIEVSDNGHGISSSEAEALYSNLGGSWKKGGKLSRTKNRYLHGQEGRGRLRAFGLGRVVEWEVFYLEGKRLKTFKVSSIRDSINRGEISDSVDAISAKGTGVTVRISEFETNFTSLKKDEAIEDLTQVFALYLRQYPEIEIYFDAVKIDPRTVIECANEIELPSIEYDGEPQKFALEIVEWKMFAERKIYLCDAKGFPLENVSAGIKAPGFNFTAYLKSDYFSKLHSDNTISIAELDTVSETAIQNVKSALKDYFRTRLSERSAGLVAKWKEENVYPYDNEPSSNIEKAERQVFNVLALNVNQYSPYFEEADEKTKKLQLRLLKHAVENAPTELSNILNEVLGLPKERQKELSDLLDRTTLSNIISASKILTDRMNFIKGLETLVFDPDIKKRVLERTQLHRLLATNPWIFGEQYNISVDDQSLTEVLRQHLGNRKNEVQVDDPVVRADGRTGVVDLMLSKNIQIAGSEEREHLIVELKRPSVIIKDDTLSQIKSYALAVAKDERFRGVSAKWVFWAISSDLDDFVIAETNQANRPRGIAMQLDNPSITIWVKTWSQVINDCKSRLQFFSEKLNYVPDRDASLEYLNNTYPKYVPKLLDL